jgi:hypothetical protein
MQEQIIAELIVYDGQRVVQKITLEGVVSMPVVRCGSYRQANWTYETTCEI